MSRTFHIVNVMLGKKKGGLEWIAIQYAVGLKEMGHHVTMVLHKQSPYKEILRQHHIPCITCAPLGEYDLVTKYWLYKKIAALHPDCLILHGRRAIKLMNRKKWPTLAVDHSANLDHVTHIDAVLAVTEERLKQLTTAGQNAYYLPNMIALTDTTPPQKKFRATERVIGFMGRLDQKKGIHLFLPALAALRKEGIPFKVLIGGVGPNEKERVQYIQENGLEKHVTFLGWVDNKKTFFDSIDMLCVPSTVESFGIVILEAWQEGVAVIGSTATGPAHLIEHDKTGWLFQRGDVEALTKTLKYVLQQPSKVLEAVSRESYQTLVTHYSRQKVMQALATILEDGIITWKRFKN